MYCMRARYNADSLLVIRIVDVCSSESEGGGTGTNVLPVVVGVGNSKMSGILRSIAVTMADQRRLPMIMEVSAISTRND